MFFPVPQCLCGHPGALVPVFDILHRRTLLLKSLVGLVVPVPVIGVTVIVVPVPVIGVEVFAVFLCQLLKIRGFG